MRLLHFDSNGQLSLTEDLTQDIPVYAILSHTWGNDADEVCLDDLWRGSGKSKPGYAKIQFCGEQARRDSLEYFWVDTCCLDKRSAWEISEAINSMFRWYSSASKCYVYLSDVSVHDGDNDENDGNNDGNVQTRRTWELAFRNSRWFTRGWTLQELLAPRQVQFFSREGDYLGDKTTLEQQIHEATGIPIKALRGLPLSDFSIEERLRWALRRDTKRGEDKSYCLLGIFGVSMPPLYGEGEDHAFLRLGREINRTNPVWDIDTWIRKECYSLHNLKVYRLSGEELPMDRCNIHLGIVQQHPHELQFFQNVGTSSGDEESAYETSPFSHFTQIQVEKWKERTQVPLSTIFNPREGRDAHKKQFKRIFIRGGAGVGKTTLCKKIVYDFLYAGMWTDLFSCLLWIPLQKLNGKAAGYNIQDLFRDVFFFNHIDGTHAARTLHKAVADSKDGETLFVLDGLDEVSQSLEKDENIFELLFYLLNQPNVIITSQSFRALPSRLNPPDLELEIRGSYLGRVGTYLEEAYPASVAGITTTRSSELSRGFSSSEHAQGTADTSVDTGGQAKDQNLADTISIYTSDIPESSGYVQELATSFFKASDLPDDESLERVLKILPDLLRGFALKIGGEQQAPVHFEIMRFLHRKRDEIAKQFEEYYLRETDDTKSLLQQAPDDMSLADKMDSWHLASGMDDPNSATPQPPPDALFLNDEVQPEGNDNPSVEDFRPSKYRDIVTNSTAFQWLLCRVHREVSLTTSEASTMNAISTQIRQILYSLEKNRVISSTRGPPICSMIFKSEWDPLAFYREQEYTEKPEDALERAIVIVRCENGDVEAMPCSEYLSRTWPLFGEDFIHLVKYAVRSQPGLRFSVTLFDKTKLTAWLEPSGCFALEAVGPVETIVEVGEVYGWMTTALRSAPDDTMSSAIPILDIGTGNQDAAFKANFRLQYLGHPFVPAGQCWQDLFGSAVVVSGFPVRRRQPGQEPGLEVSLATLAALVGTRRIVVFCGRVFLKGFCTMLVPTKYAQGTLYWHVLFNENGSRIPFTDSRVRDVVGDFNLTANLTLASLETTRHVVGWCEYARNFAGSKEANYAIGKTGPKPRGHQFVFDRASISAGKIITAGVAIGKKDKPGRRQRTSDYHKQIESIEQRFVVFYDWKDRRAWLIDGLSALLHLARASIAHRRKLGRKVLFGEDDIKESDIPDTGKVAARAVLENPDNMDLKIHERWNRPVEETSLEDTDGATPKTTIKRQRTWEHLPDLINDIYTTLEMLFDLQTDVSTTDGFRFRVQKSPRRHLEGWDFLDVASQADPLCPKATLIQEIGLGWVDLVRAINAITLFGTDFGEIIQPSGVAQAQAPGARVANPLCARWSRLPVKKDLLATTTPIIHDIMESVYRNTDNDRLWELFTDLYWHSPDKLFEGCHCGAAPATQCDRVQILLPTNFPKLFARGFRSPRTPLPAHGAVIFGHSVKFPLLWRDEAESMPTESEAVSASSHQSDSGLGASVASLVDQDSSSRAPSLLPTSSGGSILGGRPSPAPSSQSTNTRSGTDKSTLSVLQRMLNKAKRNSGASGR